MFVVFSVKCFLNACGPAVMPFPVHSRFYAEVWIQDSAAHNEPHFQAVVDGGVEDAGDNQDDRHCNVA